MHTAKANSITIEPPPLTGGTEAVYYFHSDHLGSASWITDGTGAAVQHLQYLPFGEHFVNERSAAYDERFTFTGKERDMETGYYYHGARFNSSDLGWLSVDPQFEKLPSTTPYNYCLWNPIVLHDPDGEIPVETIWDILNVAYDLGAAAYCKIQGDDAGAKEHMNDAALDLVAVAIPYVPAGASKVVRLASKGAKAVDKTVEATKATNKVKKINNTVKKTTKKQTGSYTITFESGKKYHGKGGQGRMKQSAKEKEKRYGDKAKRMDWTPAENERQAFIDEYKRLKSDGGP